MNNKVIIKNIEELKSFVDTLYRVSGGLKPVNFVESFWNEDLGDADKTDHRYYEIASNESGVNFMQTAIDFIIYPITQSKDIKPPLGIRPQYRNE